MVSVKLDTNEQVNLVKPISFASSWSCILAWLAMCASAVTSEFWCFECRRWCVALSWDDSLLMSECLALLLTSALWQSNLKMVVILLWFLESILSWNWIDMHGNWYCLNFYLTSPWTLQQGMDLCSEFWCSNYKCRF